jgi:uncharacterized membrane protein
MALVCRERFRNLLNFKILHVAVFVHNVPKRWLRITLTTCTAVTIAVAVAAAVTTAACSASSKRARSQIGIGGVSKRGVNRGGKITTRRVSERRVDGGSGVGGGVDSHGDGPGGNGRPQACHLHPPPNPHTPRLQ